MSCDKCSWDWTGDWNVESPTKEADAHTLVRGGQARDGMDTGLMEFVTAMKTPGQVAFDSLNLPKRIRHRDKEGEDEIQDGSTGLGPAKRNSRFAHLWTSLALVKGELGSRSADTHYATVHGGLQGVHAVLAAFDEKLATKASTAHLDGLVAGTNACYDKSAKACKAVEHLVTLGANKIQNT